MRAQHPFAISLIAAALTVACGGGGGGGGTGAVVAPASGGTTAVAACNIGLKTGFTGDIETTPSGTGDAAGGDGGGAGAGGAGAGGGLGKVLGGLMTVVDLSDGSSVGSATTDSATGLVTIKSCGKPGPFLVTLTGQAGAKYYDEGKDALIDFGVGNELHALVDTWDEHVGVSPFTEAAYRYALNNFKSNPAEIAAGTKTLQTKGDLTGLTKAQVQAANKLVLDEVNSRVTVNFQMTTVKTLPTPLDSGSTATTIKDNRYGRSAALNGGFVRAANNFNPALSAPALSFSDNLAKDLTDGRINGFALDGNLVSASAGLSYESTRIPIAGNIGANAVSAKFGQSLQIAAGQIIDEISSVNVEGSSLDIFLSNGTKVDCNGFRDNVALMGDGSVTVNRRFPTNVSGVCKYTYSAEENLKIQKIKNFATGIKFLSKGNAVIYAVKNDGSVIGWGDNFCGRMSPKLSNTYFTSPTVIPGLSDITSISNEYSGGIARDKLGYVYFWGFNGNSVSPYGSKKQCGQGAWSDGRPFDFYQETNIYRIQSLPDTLEVYFFGNNYFAVTNSGQLYVWGEGFAGLLGNSDGTVVDGVLRSQELVNPTLLTLPGRVRKLAFTLGTAYALLSDGSVYAWGNDDLKLIGRGVQQRTTRPVKVVGVDSIINIESVGTGGVRMQRTDGALLAWTGQDARFQFPPGSLGVFYYSPTVVASTEPVRYVTSTGNDFGVFFKSGRIANEINASYDLTSQFR